MGCRCCGFGGGGGGPGTPVEAWIKFTVTHLDFQAAALQNNILLYSLPAGGIIGGTKVKHSVVFTGPAMTNYFLSVGIVGALEQLFTEYDVLTQAVANDTMGLSFAKQTYNQAAATAIQITARSVGANLNVSTQGQADIWLAVSSAL